ncbi:unnamed protein product [Ostreobium quekettii]|uniref:Uncharacterized protein n=1 Tax=Ostreobium quekettii TaxID=121088 RepID=A0A8S1IKB0_9CHLO|nr:unnamed protein product [Ostreobium quekettii]
MIVKFDAELEFGSEFMHVILLLRLEERRELARWACWYFLPFRCLRFRCGVGGSCSAAGRGQRDWKFGLGDSFAQRTQLWWVLNRGAGLVICVVERMRHVACMWTWWVGVD